MKLRFARMLVRDPEGRFLVLHNIKLGRNRWEFPGGKMDPADLYTYRTAIRELREETGLIVQGPVKHVCEAEISVGPHTCAEESTSEWIGDFWLVDKIDCAGEAAVPQGEAHKCGGIRWLFPEEFAKLPQIPAVGVDIARKVANEKTKTVQDESRLHSETAS